MILPSNRVRIMVATKPIDFRKGHDSLAAMVKNELRKDPFTGTVFVFRARKADRLKLLYWDGTGLVMAYKRLEDATFTWPAIKDEPIHQEMGSTAQQTQSTQRHALNTATVHGIRRMVTFHQLVPLLDHVDQTRAQHIILFQRARMVLHGGTETAGSN